MLSPFTNSEKQVLLETAHASIEYGLARGAPLPVDTSTADPALRDHQACFVTLHKNGELRGCIGTLEAYRPLIEDVSEHAFAAAFRDPRFPPVQAEELPVLDIHLSILTPSTPMRFDSEADLLRQLRPGVDGLILGWGNHRGTFLPSVWESVPDRRDFLNHLKQKAGLPLHFWSDDIQVRRYETISIP